MKRSRFTEEQIIGVFCASRRRAFLTAECLAASMGSAAPYSLWLEGEVRWSGGL